VAASLGIVVAEHEEKWSRMRNLAEVKTLRCVLRCGGFTPPMLVGHERVT
jgi:hypothetical protein